MENDTERLIDDVLEHVDTEPLNEILCQDIHPIVTRIMIEATDDPAPFSLIPDLEKQISHCVTTEMMKLVMVMYVESGGIEISDLAALVMGAVRVGLLTATEYHEKQHLS